MAHSTTSGSAGDVWCLGNNLCWVEEKYDSADSRRGSKTHRGGATNCRASTRKKEV